MMEKRFAFDLRQYFTKDKTFSVLEPFTCFLMQYNFHSWLPAYHHSCLEQTMAWWASVTNPSMFSKWRIIFSIHSAKHTVFWVCSSIEYCQWITWFFIVRLLKVNCLVWLFITFVSTLLIKFCSVAPCATLEVVALKSTLISSSNAWFSLLVSALSCFITLINRISSSFKPFQINNQRLHMVEMAFWSASLMTLVNKDYSFSAFLENFSLITS